MLPRTIGPTIEIETALTEDAWWALTEPGQVELAILNLAINARDAMPAGGKLRIATKNAVRRSSRSFPPLDPGDYVMISVADTGSGMTEDVRSRAFEPFFTTKEVHKGTGLGLSMVYGVAKQCGGTVTIDSEIGCGTTVQIVHRALHGERRMLRRPASETNWRRGRPPEFSWSTTIARFAPSQRSCSEHSATMLSKQLAARTLSIFWSKIDSSTY